MNRSNDQGSTELFNRGKDMLRHEDDTDKQQTAANHESVFTILVT